MAVSPAQIAREAELPRAGAAVLGPGRPDARVTGCTGWTWPLGHDVPTRMYVSTDAGDELLPVIPGRDAQGERFWIAERRKP